MKMRFFVRFSILTFLIILFGYTFFFGASGICNYLQIKKEIMSENKKILLLEKDINKIEKTIDYWKQSTFELEKIARLNLQMGSKEEVVYLLS